MGLSQGRLDDRWVAGERSRDLSRPWRGWPGRAARSWGKPGWRDSRLGAM